MGRRARWSEGCYVLRTNGTAWSPDELWRAYIPRTDAEAAVRIQKSELRIRRVWHQRADRVQAHHPRLLSRLRAVEDLEQ